MICPSCSEETKGIKINGKVFCSICGEKIEHPTGEVPINIVTEEKKPEDQSAVVTPPPVPEAKIIPKENDLSVLNAELAALEMIEEEAIKEEEEVESAFIAELESEIPEEPKKKSTEKEPLKTKPKIEKRNIIKHNRKRTDLKPEHFMVIEGEPDPIKTPELEFPTDMEVEAAPKEKPKTKTKEEPKPLPTEEKVAPAIEPAEPEITAAEIPEETEETVVDKAITTEPGKADDAGPVEAKNILEEEMSYPLFGKGKSDELHEKKHKKQQALTNFFQASVKKPQKTVKKKKKKKEKGTKKVFLKIGVPILLVILIAGFFAYVNLYWANPKIAQQKAEEAVQFGYKRPEYIPAGYEIDQYTKGTANELEYHFTHLSDNDRILTIKISITDKTENEIFQQDVKTNGQQYLEFKSDEITYWSINEQKLIWKKDNLLYVISASDRISTDELVNIAEGLI